MADNDRKRKLEELAAKRRAQNEAASAASAASEDNRSGRRVDSLELFSTTKPYTSCALFPAFHSCRPKKPKAKPAPAPAKKESKSSSAAPRAPPRRVNEDDYDKEDGFLADSDEEEEESASDESENFDNDDDDGSDYNTKKKSKSKSKSKTAATPKKKTEKKKAPPKKKKKKASDDDDDPSDVDSEVSGEWVVGILCRLARDLNNFNLRANQQMMATTNSQLWPHNGLTFAPGIWHDYGRDDVALDTTNIISTGRRTRGKKIDYTQFGADPDDENEID
ncbi:hypothetical protein BC937DRAFT_91756 [Endogone sp. FLAS-F59071]|nr:hypothetical protein BC937DRAFT_91756 [Endogone sp. FLAS-F59071]|eukprot:RUS23171.1 hypothetical protein BC937DRAFT_91756 [Endogone sp. FLAS-F59071]